MHFPSYSLHTTQIFTAKHNPCRHSSYSSSRFYPVQFLLSRSTKKCAQKACTARFLPTACKICTRNSSK
ncbi:hypothetical protein Mp_8g17180 [Marchantia polymorpha subsp. ruderalis]|uniref:Uncharacterized protein n=1 Tax=Marchantia polymorpha TaxID=3197 RepID=A0A2R6X873_MARPO|nr:hypothetical protein MARPO_0030s0050 [Marchantia polymorpha]BBN20189.1 hypothetical protein Mp_8g17180 [Marchantia polymorpha subsp. ruderalis]|eukprot:PTQ42305.1 hypothetical protein MARPO_0030s0050 [Marchantia polymorpha]